VIGLGINTKCFADWHMRESSRVRGEIPLEIFTVSRSN